MKLQAYVPRMTRFLGLEEFDGWTVKVYGISAAGDAPSDQARAAALALIRRELPQPATSDVRYGAGFATIHEGADALWVLVDWWEHECLLQHKLFRAPLDQPSALVLADDTPTVACTWELVVICHERGAWVRHVQKQGADPKLDAYFADVLPAEAH